MSDRRVFIKQISALPLLSLPLGAYSKEKDTRFQGEREKLKEAGPMIPPVPAILFFMESLFMKVTNLLSERSRHLFLNLLI